jgi:hypothetical protein
MTQLDWVTNPPYVRHSVTSEAAAQAIKPTRVSLQQQVLNCLRVHDATDEEIQSVLRLNPSTQRPRRIELVNQGLVVDSGRTRKTKSGRNAVVWMCP